MTDDDDIIAKWHEGESLTEEEAVRHTAIMDEAVRANRHGRGGKRTGAGRPKADTPDPKRAISIKLEESLISRASAIGGNVAEGVRIALRSYRPKQAHKGD